MPNDAQRAFGEASLCLIGFVKGIPVDGVLKLTGESGIALRGGSLGRHLVKLADELSGNSEDQLLSLGFPETTNRSLLTPLKSGLETHPRIPLVQRLRQNLGKLVIRTILVLRKVENSGVKRQKFFRVENLEANQVGDLLVNHRGDDSGGIHPKQRVGRGVVGVGVLVNLGELHSHLGVVHLDGAILG